MSYHIPVLLQESVGYLFKDSGGSYCDATIGFGGHTEELLKKLDADGRLIGIDDDPKAIEYCKTKFKIENRIKLYNTNYSEIDAISRIEFIEKYDGILADLGVSSYQLDDKESGFTYRADVPLDLRMNKQKGIPAAEVVNNYSMEDIADILFKYGEERKSKIIAKKIVDKRTSIKINTTFQLREIIERSVPSRFVIKTLSRTFQALRIYVNDELNNLKIFLEKAVEHLKPGSRLVVLSYHSLEDRIVKDYFKFESLSCICPPEFPICTCGKIPRLKILTKKPITPDTTEIDMNKRARSAKLRGAERL